MISNVGIKNVYNCTQNIEWVISEIGCSYNYFLLLTCGALYANSFNYIMFEINSDSQSSMNIIFTSMIY